MAASVVVDQLAQHGPPLPRLVPAPPASAAPKVARRRKNRVTPVSRRVAKAEIEAIAEAHTSEPDTGPPKPKSPPVNPFTRVLAPRRAEPLEQPGGESRPIYGREAAAGAPRKPELG